MPCLRFDQSIAYIDWWLEVEWELIVGDEVAGKVLSNDSKRRECLLLSWWICGLQQEPAQQSFQSLQVQWWLGSEAHLLPPEVAAGSQSEWWSLIYPIPCLWIDSPWTNLEVLSKPTSRCWSNIIIIIPVSNFIQF